MKNKNGFILIDVLVGTFLTLIVFLGIFGAYQLAMKVVGKSKNRVTATAIANQKIEECRNLNYPDIESEATTTNLNNVEYTVNTIVQCIDSQIDGKAPNDANDCICDYKKIKAKVSWSGFFGGEVSLRSIISPRNKAEECQEPAGILDVSVFDAKGEMVDDPDLEVRNLNTNLQYFGTGTGIGEYEFVVPPDTNAYGVTTTKSGYTLSRTYGTGEVYNGQTIATVENECWAHPLATVLNAQRIEMSFCIDKLSKFLVTTTEAKAGRIFYVRKVGSDANDGLTPDTAFLTIQKAASSTVAGDMVLVGAGTYKEEINIPSSGSSGKEIVFVADVDGNYTGDAGTVKIDGLNYGFYIQNKKYITLYGFEVTDSSNSAIYIGGSISQNINIINNLIHDNSGYGLDVVDAKNIILSHNSIYDNGIGSTARGIHLDNADFAVVRRNKVYKNGWGGISASNSGSAEIDFNEVYDNKGVGIFVEKSNNVSVKNNLSYKNESDGIKARDCAKIEISQNKSYSNQGSGIKAENKIRNASKIVSNLVYANKGSGIVLTDNSVNNTISNNTSYKNEENGILVELSSNNNELKDNIVVSNILAGIKVSDSPNVETTYSNVWDNTPNYDGITATSSISVDPLFVDPDGADNILGGDNEEDDSFHLSQVAAGQAQDSPCLDTGSDSASALEMDDKTTRTDEVTDAGVVDMGFHYSLESPPPTPDSPDPFGPIIPNTNFHLRGEKTVGKTAAEEPIYKYSKDHQTDAFGFIEISDLEWDNYYFSDFSAAGQDLDLIISYPSSPPIYLNPDTTLVLKLGLRAENTLLVRVIDASTTDPIPLAGVRVYDTDYDQTKIADETGEVYFIPLAKQRYNIEAGATGYASSTDSVKVDGHIEKTIELPRIE